MRKLREFAKDFLQEEDAVGVVEIILIRCSYWSGHDL